MQRDGDFSGHAKSAGPVADMPTLAVIIVTNTQEGNELLILLKRTYYRNARDIINKQLYNYVEIQVVITLFDVFMVVCAAGIIW